MAKESDPKKVKPTPDKNEDPKYLRDIRQGVFKEGGLAVRAHKLVQANPDKPNHKPVIQGFEEKQPGILLMLWATIVSIFSPKK